MISLSLSLSLSLHDPSLNPQLGLFKDNEACSPTLICTVLYVALRLSVIPAADARNCLVRGKSSIRMRPSYYVFQLGVAVLHGL